MFVTFIVPATGNSKLLESNKSQGDLERITGSAPLRMNVDGDCPVVQITETGNNTQVIMATLECRLVLQSLTDQPQSKATSTV